jgi:DNA primase
MLVVFSYLRIQRENGAVGEDVEKLKQRLPLLDYLRQQSWTARPIAFGPEFVGLCPLHPETRPSFYVNARKNLFYCHGCGQGGDLIRFVQLSRHLSFRQSLAYLEQQSTVPADSAAVLERTATFYQQQLDRYAEALRYLEQRGLRDPALIKELRIGYAPGGSLRRHLVAQGYSCELLKRLGLLNAQGCDAFYQRVIFPCCQGGRVVNLYGRHPQRVPRCSLPDRSRFSSSFFAAKADGSWPAASSDEPAASESAQTQHRAALSE